MSTITTGEFVQAVATLAAGMCANRDAVLDSESDRREILDNAFQALEEALEARGIAVKEAGRPGRPSVPEPP